MRKHQWDDRNVAVIGLGTGEFGGTCPESLAGELMDAYVSIGGNLIDTARVYGDFKTPKNGESEKVIGRWLARRHCRDQIFLSTKGGHPPLGKMWKSRLSREEVRRDMAESLEDLQTDSVDIYWLHRDDESRPVGEIMETLQSLVEDGSAKRIGVSNWKTQRIIEASRYAADHGLTPLSGNQPQFSLAKQAHMTDITLKVMNDEMRRMHLEQNLPCVCFSSQARGYLSRLEQGGAIKLPMDIRWQFHCRENQEILKRAQQVSRETGLSLEAVALAYLTCQPFPCYALVGTAKPERVLVLREAGDAALTDAQRDFLRPWS